MQFHSSVETIGWFKDRYLEGSLTLRPPYQRNAVWMLRQKAYLVESVLKSLPIPEVFVEMSTNADGQTSYAVVDGQQRIRSLLQFVGAESDADQVEYDAFRLDSLESSSDWFGRDFSELAPKERKSFFGYRLSVRYLEAESESEIKEMFRRLNKFTAPLKPAELRNATYAGPFALLAAKFAEDHADFLAENKIITAASIRRMGDIEFFAELMIGAMHGPQGGSPTAIDEYYQTLEDFEDEFPREREIRRVVPKVLRVIDELLPALEQTRWSNKSDFYSLFVALAHSSVSVRTDEDRSTVASKLLEFGDEVESALEDEDAEVTSAAAKYARSISRGANDKTRRVVRHGVLIDLLES